MPKNAITSSWDGRQVVPSVCCDLPICWSAGMMDARVGDCLLWCSARRTNGGLELRFRQKRQVPPHHLSFTVQETWWLGRSTMSWEYMWIDRFCSDLATISIFWFHPLFCRLIGGRTWSKPPLPTTLSITPQACFLPCSPRPNSPILT